MTCMISWASIPTRSLMVSLANFSGLIQRILPLVAQVDNWLPSGRLVASSISIRSNIRDAKKGCCTSSAEIPSVMAGLRLGCGCDIDFSCNTCGDLNRPDVLFVDPLLTSVREDAQTELAVGQLTPLNRDAPHKML